MLNKDLLKVITIFILSVCLIASLYINCQQYTDSSKGAGFDRKQTCANYQPEMRKQIEEFHGEEQNYELREVFYSQTLDSCLYYYVISLGNGNEVYFLKDYLTNKDISQSLPIPFEKTFDEKTKFEKSFNQYR